MPKRIIETELKKIELGILSAVDNFCRTHGLTYFLAYGTLLGAIRHQGFIPWDDDIDIWMPRKDYTIFADKFNSAYKEYKLLNAKNTEGYYMVQGKVIDNRTLLRERVTSPIDLGVFIDVFVLDDIPCGKESESIIKKIKRYRNILLVKNTVIESNTRLRKNATKYDPFIYKVAQLFLKFLSTKRAIIRIDELCSRMKTSGKINNCGCISAMIYGSKEIMLADWFSDKVDVKFEDQCFYAPLDYDKVLTQLYGDYMRLPNEEDRHTTHNFEVYWK